MDKPILICMRLAEMELTHPLMTRDKCCSRCGVTIGMFPSGQRVLREHGETNVEIVCNHCHFPAEVDLYLMPSEVPAEIREAKLRNRDKKPEPQ